MKRRDLIKTSALVTTVVATPVALTAYEPEKDILGEYDGCVKWEAWEHWLGVNENEFNPLGPGRGAIQGWDFESIQECLLDRRNSGSAGEDYYKCSPQFKKLDDYQLMRVCVYVLDETVKLYKDELDDAENSDRWVNDFNFFADKEILSGKTDWRWRT
jgi:hypothetical protein